MKLKHLIILAVLIGFFFNLYFILTRIDFDYRYNRYNIVYYYKDLKRLADLQNKDIVLLLSEFKEKDIPVTGLMFYPVTIKDLEYSNRILVYKGMDINKVITIEGFINPVVIELYNKINIVASHYYIFFKDNIDFIRVKRVLSEYLPANLLRDRSDWLKIKQLNKQKGYLLEVATANPEFLDLPLFYDEVVINDAKNLGYDVILGIDFDNGFNITENLKPFEGIKHKKLNCFFVYLKTNNKINIPDNLFKVFSNSFVILEEFQIKRFNKGFLWAIKHNLLRAHEAPEDMFYKCNFDYLLYRYIKAIRERSVRVAILHLFNNNKIDSNILFLKDLQKRLESFIIPSRVGDFNNIAFFVSINKQLRIFIFTFLIVMLFLIMLHPLLELTSLGNFFIIIITSFLLAFGILYVEDFYFERIVAQFLSFFAPIFGYLYWRDIYNTKEVKNYGIFIKPLRYLLFITLSTFYGAITLNSLLDYKEFILKIEEFRSVKLALIVPLILYLFYLLLHYSSREKIIQFINNPIKIWQIILGFVLFIILVVFLMRSGNISHKYIPDFEVKLRGILNDYLLVRPRFKEFLWGYPLFIIAFFFRPGYWRVALLFLSVIAQISMFNTFCHIHTPFIVSLIRSLNGFIIGSIIGLICLNLFIFIRKVWLRI